MYSRLAKVSFDDVLDLIIFIFIHFAAAVAIVYHGGLQYFGPHHTSIRETLCIPFFYQAYSILINTWYGPSLCLC